MFEGYLILTAVVILATLWACYQRSRDPLSPLVVFAPMLLYVYVYHPYVISRNAELDNFFRDPADIEYILLVNLVSLCAFCLGASHHKTVRGNDQRFRILDLDASPRTRQRFLSLALLLGTVSFAAFWWLVSHSGGVVRMFQTHKPYFVSASGYVGELPMLTFPALLLMATAWQGKKMTASRLLIALYIASPQITWSIIGKRRGTIFLTVTALAATWYLIKNKKPNWKVIFGGVTMLGLLLLFVFVNRKATPQSDMTVAATLTGEQRLTPGDEFVAAGAMILASERYSHHFWGVRVFAMFIVRPIPSFLWPDKWKFMGLEWMETHPGLYGLTTSQWQQALDFNPALGTAGGFVADAFMEWSWGGVIACYALGYIFSWLWKKWVLQGGVWTIIYVESMILSIFLPSQSLGAWAYRFALLVVPTAIIFRHLIPTSRPSSNAPTPSSQLYVQQF